MAVASIGVAQAVRNHCRRPSSPSAGAVPVEAPRPELSGSRQRPGRLRRAFPAHANQGAAPCVRPGLEVAATGASSAWRSPSGTSVPCRPGAVRVERLAAARGSWRVASAPARVSANAKQGPAPCERPAGLKAAAAAASDRRRVGRPARASSSLLRPPPSLEAPRLSPRELAGRVGSKACLLPTQINSASVPWPRIGRCRCERSASRRPSGTSILLPPPSAAVPRGASPQPEGSRDGRIQTQVIPAARTDRLARTTHGAVPAPAPRRHRPC